MKKIQKLSQEVLQELVCNKCGKRIALKDGIPREGVCSVEIPWSYFSRKDGEIHRFELCEDCYDEWVARFTVPVEVIEETELL